jgi:hypothetical protein
VNHWKDAVRIARGSTASTAQLRAPTFEDARTAQIWNESAPAEGWWGKLFVDRPDRDGVDALISHPIDNSWLLGKTLRGYK